MPSDVKLDGEKLTLEGEVEIRPTNSQLKIHGYDLLLDSPERRPGTDLTKDRRALVHGPNDTLFVNWDNDYKGGVVINGPVQLPNVSSIGDVPSIGKVKSISLQDVHVNALLRVGYDSGADTKGFVGLVAGNHPVGIPSFTMRVERIYI